MKPNADEPIDRLVREALAREADRPVPSFNPDRTWARLTQELQPEKNRRRPVAWLWAASLTGLLLVIGAGWYLRGQKPIVSGPTFVKTKPVRPSQPAPVVSLEKPEESGLAEQKQPERLSRHAGPVRGVPARLLPPPTGSVPERVDTSAPSQPEVVQVAGGPESPTVVPAAASGPKRRFQVMHINEYQAEEDAQPRLYRTESMVRLGSPPSPDGAVAPPSVQIILPQRHKSN